jgi:hypothetical protein
MSNGQSDSDKPASVVTDYIIPCTGNRVNIATSHINDLNVLGSSRIYGPVNLDNTRVINSADPIDGADVVTKNYFDSMSRHLLGDIKGRLVSTDGVVDTAIPVSYGGYGIDLPLVINMSAPTSVSWDVFPFRLAPISVTWSGPWAPRTAPFAFAKWGNVVSVTTWNVYALPTVISYVTAPPGSIPVDYRPVESIVCVMGVADNGGRRGAMTFNPDGSMVASSQEGVAFGTFGLAGVAGFVKGCLYYSLL